MANPDDICAVCPRTRAAHDDPDVHHQYSANGQLVPKVKEKPKPANAREHIIAPGDEPVAVRLSAILHTKGLIDDDELVYVLTGGKRPDGSDSSARHSITGDISAGASAASG